MMSSPEESRITSSDICVSSLQQDHISTEMIKRENDARKKEKDTFIRHSSVNYRQLNTTRFEDLKQMNTRHYSVKYVCPVRTHHALETSKKHIPGFGGHMTSSVQSLRRFYNSGLQQQQTVA